MTRVVYLSNTELGREMFSYLTSLPCDVVCANTSNGKIKWPICSEYDLGISFLYQHKIPASEMQGEHEFRWVNYHPAPLPEFGGRNLAYHAIMRNAKWFGATVHYMDENYDTGELIDVQRFEIKPYDTAGDLVTRSHWFLKSLFLQWTPLILKGKVLSTPQDRSKAHYYPKGFILDSVRLPGWHEKHIRALSCPPRHYAKIEIAGKMYRIIPEVKP